MIKLQKTRIPIGVLCVSIFLVLSFLTAAASLTTSVVFTGGNSDNPVIILKEADRVSAQVASGLRLPGRIRSAYNEPVTVAYQLPVKIGADNIFSVKTNYCDITASVDGKMIFSQHTEGKYPLGKIYNNIPLSPEMAGKTLLISFQPYRCYVSLSEVMIGTFPQIELHLADNNLFFLLVCLFGVLIGVAFLVIGLSLAVKKYRAMSVFISFGAFSLVLFGWGITEIPKIMFWNNNNSVLYYLSFIQFMMIPVFLMPLFKTYLGGGNDKVFDRFRYVALGHTVLSFLLHLCGVFPLYYSIYLYYILVGVLIFVCIHRFLKQLKTNRADMLLPLLCCLSLLSCVLITMIGYFAWNDFEGVYYLLGLVLCLIFIVISAYAFLNRMMMTLSMTEYYRELSLTDRLTGTGNRNSYEIRLKNITQYEVVKKSIGFLMIDIDAFKKLNDGYGHAVGDEVLSYIGSCVKNLFDDIGDCYRIGGDEFAIIIKDSSCEVVATRVEKLHREIKSVSSHLSVSCGCGYRLLNNEIPSLSLLMTIISEADSDMYAQKRGEETKLTKM